MDFGGTLFNPAPLVCTPVPLVISSLTLPSSYSATLRAVTFPKLVGRARLPFSQEPLTPEHATMS